jgi:hypothetical protein
MKELMDRYREGTVPDLRTEQSEVVESGLSLVKGHFPDEN